ncbi:hypothetical protein RB653_006463 [Dictyostelium firmibasis]|uniref:FACT complex subunit n=1 Tax=Dictyostelium firmibasis TaxID=79012 RepID=A0AAN7UB99_9MYCE
MSQSTTTTTTAPKEATLDAVNFCKRIKILYDSWNSDSNLWKSANSLVLALGQPNESNPYQKVTSLQTWLFGYELKDTIIVFLEKEIYFVSTPKKINLFQKLSESEQVQTETSLKFNFLTIDKSDKNKSNFEKLIGEATKAGSNIGVIIKETYIGDLALQWEAALNECSLNKVDITPALSSCLLVKDLQEQKNIITSAKITSKVLKSHILPKIETIIDKGERQTHNQLADYAADIFESPEKISSKLTVEHVDYSYVPIIQSGGVYDLRASASSDDNPLHFGTIIVSCGARYKNYCSNIARTYIIDPTNDQKKNYGILLNVQNSVIKAIKPDVPFSSLYEKAIQTIKESSKPELVDHFPKNVGYGIGIEFQESLAVLNATNSRTLKSGMTLNIVCGFQKISNPEGKDEKSKIYSLLISDTVLLNDEGKVEVLTDVGKKASDVVYMLGGDDDDDDDDNDPSIKLELPDDVKGITGRTRETKEKSKSVEERRRDHQKMLEQKNLQEAENKIKAMNDPNGKKGTPEVDYTAITKLQPIYNSVGAFPQDIVKNKMYIDPKKETVLFPMFGYMVPFHISTIKNISKSEEYIRVNFNTPTSYTQEQIDAGFVPPQLMYIREVTYKVNDPKVLANNIRLIKELKKKFTTRETEDREKRNLITQEKLILSRGKFPRLPEVHARPTLSGARRTIGILEAHENGIRFNPTSTKDRTPIDVLYKNIKHAIYQQADQESMAVIHFHLHDALMIGKKKTKDVQFYIEISEMSQSLDVSSRFNDEEEEERRERALKEKINNDFKNFIKRVEEIVPEPGLEFDVPYRELGFYGVPNVSTVFIQPSVHCLLSILEPPFFVLTLDDVEIACFERAIRSLKNFDLSFVFKDYNRPPIRISVIPRNYFETVKEWLDSFNIKFYQSERNYNWKRIMDTIKSDVKKFHDDGGWSFLDLEEEEEEDDEGDDDYVSNSESSESSDYISSMSSGSDDDDEDSSEGENWEDLEQKAERDDKKKTFEDSNKRKRDEKSGSSSSSSISSNSKPSSSKSGSSSSGSSKSKSSSSSSSKGSSSSSKGSSSSSKGSSKKK